MYAKYVTSSAPTIAQVISDIAQLLAGASIASLSASCDKSYSVLVNTVAPGWTVADTAAPNSGQVVSAPDANGLTTKYARIFASTATAIDIAGYETWNSTTHAGTNSTPSNTTIGFASATVNTYWIFATPRSLYITTINNGTGVFEFTRDCNYLVGTTYPCFAVATSNTMTSTAGSLYVPRIKALSAAGDYTGVGATLNTGTIVAKNVNTSGLAGSPNASIQDASGNWYYEMRPYWVVNSTPSSLIAPTIIGKMYDVVEIASGAGNAFDTISDGTNTYMFVPKNTGSLLFKVA